MNDMDKTRREEAPQEKAPQEERRDSHGVRLQEGSTLWRGWPDDPEMRKRMADKQRETKRRQRTFRDSVRAIVFAEVPDAEKKKQLEAIGADPTVLNAIHIAVSKRARAGDVEAARYLRDTAGERPREGIEIGGLDGKPIQAMDLSGMMDDQLRALAAQYAEEGGEQE